MHMVTMTVDLFWVGFRMGHFFLVLAPVLAARALVRVWSVRRHAAFVIGAVVLIIGSPTTIIDAFNAQDIENDHMGPGFKWTVKISPAEQQALEWIRDHTPVNAIVQAESMARGRETWSLIPSWGRRRMAGGQPISLMHVPEYDLSSAQVEEIYATPDAARAWRLAVALGIDYLYVGVAEREAYAPTAKFESAPDLFVAAFKNREVSIFSVAHSRTVPERH